MEAVKRRAVARSWGEWGDEKASTEELMDGENSLCGTVRTNLCRHRRVQTRGVPPIGSKSNGMMGSDGTS